MIRLNDRTVRMLDASRGKEVPVAVPLLPGGSKNWMLWLESMKDWADGCRDKETEYPLMCVYWGVTSVLGMIETPEALFRSRAHAAGSCSCGYVGDAALGGRA